MNLEGITLHILTKKLQKTLIGGKITKIFMPTHSSLLLIVRKDNDTIPLLADFSGESPLLYLPDSIPENPETPPAFCMLLRKHLEDGRISSLEQTGLDRIITLEIDLIGSARQIVTKKLVFELTGKNSNIIFLENEVVIDSLKHVNKSMSSFRQVLPNQPYFPPPTQNGLSFIYTSPLDIVAKIMAQNAKKALQSLITETTGIGKFTATELLQRSNISLATTTLTAEERNILIAQLSLMQNNIKEHAVKTLPVYGIITKQNRMSTVVLSKPLHLDNTNFTIKEFADLNTALNCAAKLVPIKTSDRDILQKTVTSAIARTEKKLTMLEKDLTTAEGSDSQKVIADTLMSNIYMLKKGLDSCTLKNIYNNEELNIPLSPLLTPVENAQAYYKRYNKYKRAIEEINRQIFETKDMLTYLRSIDVSLQTASNNAEVAEIKQELIAEGILIEHKKGRGKGPQTKSQPLTLKLSPDTTVYIGKNNKQNDFVTFSIARTHDFWFHTKGFPGSHVILKTTLQTPTEKEIKTAAHLAAYFSKARDSSNVPVDYTEKRFVKKPSGAKPGFVIYTNQQTLYVTPDAASMEALFSQN
ncbi:MAG: fibronectin-binding domain-containing protein [Negativicutes bacterium]|nr:fibronectin-binding domain-containing protein [Negativicutes bacterium]